MCNMACGSGNVARLRWGAQSYETGYQEYEGHSVEKLCDLVKSDSFGVLYKLVMNKLYKHTPRKLGHNKCSHPDAPYISYGAPK